MSSICLLASCLIGFWSCRLRLRRLMTHLSIRFFKELPSFTNTHYTPVSYTQAAIEGGGVDSYTMCMNHNLGYLKKDESRYYSREYLKSEVDRLKEHNQRLIVVNAELLRELEDIRYRNERLECDLSTMKQLLSWRGKRKYNATQRKIDASQLYR